MDTWPSLESSPLSQEPSRREPARLKIAVREVIQVVLVVLLVRLAMDTLLPRYMVDGASMEPAFSTDQRVIVDRLSMLLGGPSRGDVVVLDSPRRDELLIKRVIGLPGETVTVQAGRVYINGELLEEPYVQEFCTYPSCNGTWVLGPEEYFVLGDNRSHSMDSHTFGPVSRSAIKGIARLRYWPPDELEIITAPHY